MTNKAALEMIESIVLKCQLGHKTSTDTINEVSNVIIDWNKEQEEKRTRKGGGIK